MDGGFSNVNLYRCSERNTRVLMEVYRGHLENMWMVRKFWGGLWGSFMELYGVMGIMGLY